MAYALMQNAFLSGELSPDVSARINIEAYASGAAEIYNAFVDYRGGVMNRAGTQWVFVAPTTNAGYTTGQEDWTPHLLPFVYSDDQSMVIIMSERGLYFISDGAPVLGSSTAITAITQASPGVVTAAGHGLVDTDFAYIRNVAGMTEVNNRYFYIDGVVGDTFQLRDLFTSAPVNTAVYGAYTSGGFVQRVYRVIPSPAIDPNDLWSFKAVQIRDQLIFVSPFYPPKLVTRVSNTNWTIVDIDFESSTAAPTGLSENASFTGSGTTYTYVVTATDSETGIESEASAEEQADLDYWPTPEDNIRIEWSAVTGAEFYSIYRAPVTPGRGDPAGTLKGLIGQTRGLKFDDHQIGPNYSITPPKARNPFNATGKYPSSVTFAQQRVFYAGTVNRPFKAWATPVGDFTSLDTSQPPRDTDSIQFELASTRADPIKNLLAMPGGLLAFTTEAVYHIYGGADGSPLTPYNINADPVSRFGAGDLPPIGVGFHVLYTQINGGLIRDLQYNFYAASYESTDITILASHLFKDMKIMRWAYSEVPHKIVWAVRNDGKLLSLTYVPEQNIFAFALHSMQGFIRDVCVIPEGEEDVLYLAVCRPYLDEITPFNTDWALYTATIERMRSRQIMTIEDAWFLDNGLNSTLTLGTAAIKIAAATGVGVAVEDIDAQNSFSASVVGRIIRAGGGMMEITAKTDANNVTVTITRPITNLFPDGTPMLVGPDKWSMDIPFSTFRGLWHLEGQEVMVLADGGVQGPFTVEDGAITLDDPASYVVIGISYKSRLKTLRPAIDDSDGSTQEKRKNIPSVMMRMSQTRGVKIGPNYDELDTWNPRIVQPLGQPPPLVTGDEHVIIGGTWNEEGQICIEQSDPLPMSILGLVEEVEFGDS